MDPTSPPSPAPRSRSRKLWWIPVLPTTIGLLAFGWYLGARFVWFNLHEVVPGQVFRSSQPSPAFLERTVHDKNIRCVLKLNSPKESDWSRAESAEAAKLGVRFINIPMGVSRLPTREELLSLIDAISSAPRPLLIHCKIGSDRTGVASTLLAMHDGATFDQAVASQLSIRYLHVGHIGEAVEDVIYRYRSYCEESGKPTGGWDEFVDFARNAYHPTDSTRAAVASSDNVHPQ